MRCLTKTTDDGRRNDFRMFVLLCYAEDYVVFGQGHLSRHFFASRSESENLERFHMEGLFDLTQSKDCMILMTSGESWGKK